VIAPGNSSERIWGIESVSKMGALPIDSRDRAGRQSPLIDPRDSAGWESVPHRFARVRLGMAVTPHRLAGGASGSAFPSMHEIAPRGFRSASPRLARPR
jgi:hypothetical protein